jgi:hypothetical protein
MSASTPGHESPIDMINTIMVVTKANFLKKLKPKVCELGAIHSHYYSRRLSSRIHALAEPGFADL